MKFTRKQELALIEIGLSALITSATERSKSNGHSPMIMEPVERKDKKKRPPMSAAARRAISRRMKQMWAEKSASK